MHSVGAGSARNLFLVKYGNIPWMFFYVITRLLLSLLHHSSFYWSVTESHGGGPCGSLTRYFKRFVYL